MQCYSSSAVMTRRDWIDDDLLLLVDAVLSSFPRGGGGDWTY
jgi:hypothetical protein